MEYTQEELQNALDVLSAKYPDDTTNNNKSIGADDKKLILRCEKYIKRSMKRSNIKNVRYEQCTFKNAALTDSNFYSVDFADCKINGSSFACCNFYDSNFDGTDSKPYSANNFSQSNFTNCKFYKNTFCESGFLHTLFNQCVLEETCFRSSTMEGSRFQHCKLSKMDLGNMNVEFIELLHTSLAGAVFPFYQFSYIIGAADYIKDQQQNILLRAGEQVVSLQEYRDQVDNLILYYADKNEYFPVCNLQIMCNRTVEAVHSLLNGINDSLHNLDFRMIRHYCQLARHHDLLDEVTIRKISKQIENHLIKHDIPPAQLNECMIHLGEIREILLGGNSQSVTLSLNVRTNICKKNRRGMDYVNSLCNQLNAALSETNYGQTGFQVAVSNHSPFEIIVNVICAAGAVATIADLLWHIIDRHNDCKNDNLPEDFKPVDQDLYRTYLNTRIDLCKEQLMRIQNTYSSKKMNKYIEDVTQQLKTDISALYENEIMIFKKDNHDKS